MFAVKQLRSYWSVMKLKMLSRISGMQVFDPMAASTNAVTLFLGTVWTNRTLLARQMRFCRELEQKDGIKRVFAVDWHEVAQELPAYGERVKSRIEQFGPDHPFIRTEYELKELDGSGGLFNAW
jgi:hypothetical protein